MVLQDELLKAGFSNNQIEEIKAGLKAGLDIDKYADKKYHSIQMRQIRLGLEKGLPVEYYADPKYDWLQMEELRKGLEDDLDVAVYADYNIPYDKMQQLREGLKDGLNLLEYLKYSAGIIGQLHKALLDSVNILPYVEEGYDAEQLQEIRIALARKIDLDPYLSKEYRSPALAEIREGLAIGVDVSVYAKVDYSWLQMREIRLGMENRIDVSHYASPYYSWEQMREIRTGLQEGLDVSDYGRLRFPASEMRRRHNLLRKQMLAQSVVEQPKAPEETLQTVEHTTPVEEPQKHQETSSQPVASTGYSEEIYEEMVKNQELLLAVEQNAMVAFITITRRREVPSGVLYKFLEANGIRRGINDDRIAEIAEGHYEVERPILIAQGQISRKGKDGWYEYFFRTEFKRSPKQRADGSVDFRNIDWFETVQENQMLAIYHGAEEGEEGYTVYGSVVSARKGTEQKMLRGEGFYLDDDQRTYRASVSGMITLEGTHMTVSKHMDVPEVNFATGDLTFDGSIHVLGNVENGVKIKATGDIVVSGNVGSAYLESDANVVLEQGMNADGEGSIKAGKDVNSRFFESVSVEAGGDIRFNTSLNSTLIAHGKIESALAVAGGLSYSMKGFVLQNVGNKAGLRTQIRLGINEALKQERAELKQQQVDVQAEISTLKNAYSEMQSKFPPEFRVALPMYQKVENAIFTKEREMNELLAQEQELLQRMRQENDAKIVIRGEAFEGVSADINSLRWKANNEYDFTLKLGNQRILVISNK